MKILRVGMVGAGSIVRQKHLPGLQQIENVQVVAVSNSTPASSQKFLDEEKLAARAIGNWEALVQDSGVDVVWIGAHPDLHMPVTVAALQAGKHVFCQARMARDLPEAKRMLAAADASPQLVTMLCPPPYGLKQDAFIRELLEQNIVGEIQHLHLRSLNGSFLDPAAPAHWRQRREISGRNVMTLGIYTEVLQRWFGSIDWVEAKGRIATPDRRGYRVEIPEELEVFSGFTRGFQARWNFSNISTEPPTDALTIRGTRGELSLDFQTDEIRLECEGEITMLKSPEHLLRPWRVERDFIEAVRHPEEPRPHPTFEDGIAYMEVVQAVEDARISGARVRVTS